MPLNLFAFFMKRVLTAMFAKLFKLKLVRSLSLIFRCGVILILTLRTIETHDNTHKKPFSKK
jgi:hypothetical protein